MSGAQTRHEAEEDRHSLEELRAVTATVPLLGRQVGDACNEVGKALLVLVKNGGGGAGGGGGGGGDGGGGRGKGGGGSSSEEEVVVLPRGEALKGWRLAASQTWFMRGESPQNQHLNGSRRWP